MFKIIRKSDIVLFFILLALGIGLSVPGFTSGSSEGGSGSVVITVSGDLYGTYELSRDAEITISEGGHTNKVIIKDEAVQMIEASCHNQVCVKQGKIDRPNQSIVCLPNRIVVRITNAKGGGDVDVISG